MQILIEGLSRDYFTAFSNKDSQTLSKMFDSDIELMDWEVNCKGKESVMANNQELFDSVKEIKIAPELIAVYGLTAMAKISVEVDGAKLKVVDIITFNNLGKIIKIEAYKR
jgi:ketosteroid isomerase-like protein